MFAHGFRSRLFRDGIPAQRFRRCIDQLIERYPGLFPPEIDGGYWLHDIVRSKKQQLSMRRIKVVATGNVYQVRPDFVTPYMIGKIPRGGEGTVSATVGSSL